jgi:pimeloyl-ACP methyl ester carboxylesterase
MGKLENWRDLGYTKELNKDYQLILMDCRGHGESDRPVEPGSYQPDVIAGDILAVMDELGIEKAHYFGYSLAAKIGYCCLARYALPRFHSLILGGMSPYRTDVEVQISENRMMESRMMAEQGMDAYIAFLEKRDGPMSPRAKAQLYENDPNVVFVFTAEYEYWPSAEDILTEINVPCLVYAGEKDPRATGAKKAAGIMPHATFILLPKLSHPQGWSHSDVVLPIVKKFLAEVSKNIK